jgi:hypothetical protein
MIYQKSTEEKALLKELKASADKVSVIRSKPKPKLSMAHLYSKLVLTINLHNLTKQANFKTTYTFNIVMEDEIDFIINDGVFFPANEVKSVYLNHKLYKR